MNKAKAFCTRHRKWLIVLAVLAGIALMVAAVRAATLEPRTIAEPPTEQEITFDFGKNRVYEASDGIIVIGDSTTPVAQSVAATAPASATSMQVEIVTASNTVPMKAGGAYTLPEDAQLPDGSIGLLNIPKLSLSVHVYETADEMEAMTHGLAHFKTTSAWEGNIGVCGHNQNFDLSDGHFKRLHTLSEGDIITYQTALGTKTYAVKTVAEIAADDWSWLGRTEDNRITMITCISGKPDSRLMVQAVEKA
jgi:LPXTG-site transpeptidase (sortase) family protein